MCLKKLFPNWYKPEPIPVPVPIPEPIPIGNHVPTRRALLFGDNYPDTSYQLNGCIHDIDDVEYKLNKEMPGFIITKFKNAEVTCSRFYTEIKNALLASQAGDFILIWYSGHGTQLPSNHEADGYDEALYLNDGPFTDDKMMELQQFTPAGVIVDANFDSCFSAGMAKEFGNPNSIKSKFHQMPGTLYMTKKVKTIAKTSSKWAIFAGCGEGQTSADAWFNNRANGAYTYYALKSFGPGVSFDGKIINIRKLLPSKEFEQAPELFVEDLSLLNYKY
jgi:hypothetical protein